MNESNGSSTTTKIVMESPTHSGRDLEPKSWFEKLCRRLPHKEIGWQEGGYLEKQSRTFFQDTPSFKMSVVTLKRRYPGQILYRPASHAHDVITPFGRSWSLVVTGRKAHKWGFLKCGD